MEKKKIIPKKKDENMVNVWFEKPLEVRQIGGSSSVEIKRNSKGGAEFVVKIYEEDPEKAKEKAIKIFKDLNKQFPGE